MQSQNLSPGPSEAHIEAKPVNPTRKPTMLRLELRPELRSNSRHELRLEQQKHSRKPTMSRHELIHCYTANDYRQTTAHLA